MEMKSVTVLLLICAVFGLNAFDLDCNFDTMDLLYISGFRSNAKNLNIETRYQKLSSVNGLNLNAFDGSSYKFFNIRYQTVKFIPQEMGKFFPNTESFETSNSKLQEVCKEDIAQFPKLKQLHLYGNELQSLPGDLFEGNPELLFVYLSSNKLKTIGHDLLKPLKKLEQAFFRSNVCIDVNVSKQDKIPEIVAAIKANCSDSKTCETQTTTSTTPATTSTSIERFEKQLKSCEKLLDVSTRQLFLSSSSSENFPQTSPKDIEAKCRLNSSEKKCELFDLFVEDSKSIIEKFVYESGKTIENLEEIEKLSIVDQETLFLPSNLRAKLPNLKEISVINSGLFGISDEMFANLTSLNSLVISKNKLREIPKNSLDIRNLHTLSFANNNIEIIHNGAFNHLGSLREMDLKNNLLTYIDPEIFANLISLETLQLQQNKINFVNSGLFANLPQLVRVDISNNLIDKLPGELVSPKNSILEFKAASNKLRVIDQKLIKRLRKSELIDFSSNDCINMSHKNSSDSFSLRLFNSEVTLNCTPDDEN